MGLGSSHLGQNSRFILYLDTSQLNKQFPLLFALLGGSFVFLDAGPSILFLVFPSLFWVLWLICGWQGFIKQFLPCYKTLAVVWQEISGWVQVSWTL
jgi:hypothetical protein